MEVLDYTKSNRIGSEKWDNTSFGTDRITPINFQPANPTHESFLSPQNAKPIIIEKTKTKQETLSVVTAPQCSERLTKSVLTNHRP